MEEKNLDINIVTEGINQRIIQFINAEGFRLGEFADKLGIPRSRMTHIKNNRNKPNVEFIIKMLYTFKNLNPEWLLLGTGSMYKVPPHKIVLDTEPEQTPNPEPPEREEPGVPAEPEPNPSTEKEPAKDVSDPVEPSEVENKTPSKCDTSKQEVDKSNSSDNQGNTPKDKSETTQPTPAIITGPDGLPQQILILYPDRTFVAYKSRDNN